MKIKNPKSRKILMNAVILSALDVLLIVYFSTNYLWGIATAAIIVLISALSGLQFWLYYEFFIKENNSKKRK